LHSIDKPLIINNAVIIAKVWLGLLFDNFLTFLMYHMFFISQTYREVRTESHGTLGIESAGLHYVDTYQHGVKV